MEVTVSKKKLDETKTTEGVKSLLYEARMNPSHGLQAEVELKKTLQGINPQFNLSLMASENLSPALFCANQKLVRARQGHSVAIN